MQHFAPAAAVGDEGRTTSAFVAAFLAKCLRVGGFFDGDGDDEEVMVVGALEHLG